MKRTCIAALLALFTTVTSLPVSAYESDCDMWDDQCSTAELHDDYFDRVQENEREWQEERRHQETLDAIEKSGRDCSRFSGRDQMYCEMGAEW